jgi:hypothetical protein
MARRKLVIEDDHVGLKLLDERFHFLDLPPADVGSGVGFVEALERLADDVDAGRVRQPGQLFQAGLDRQ